MAIYALDDREPSLARDAWVHPDATVIGSVTLGEGSSVWPGAVLRGDYGVIRIGHRTNIQDGAVIHAIAETPTQIGDEVVVGHLSHLEGCTVENGALIGSGSIVLNGAVIGSEALVGAAALVPSGMVVPPRAMALGVPARVISAAVAKSHAAGVASDYVRNAEHYRRALRRID